MAKQPPRAKTRKRAMAPKSEIPERIYAQASPRSLGKVPLFEAQHQIRHETVGNFFSDSEVIDRAVNRLQDAGFEVLQVTPITINIAGDRKTYERAFKTTIVAEEREVIKELGKKDTATFLESPDTQLPGLLSTAGTNMADLIEGVALEEPRYYMAPSIFAPLKTYWHLRLPGDVSLAANADRAHRGGITGKSVRVAMADSGWFKHPFFVERGYRAAPVVLAPGAVNAAADEVGHGTGESANIFAVAPDVQLLPVKMSFVNTVAAFNTAVGVSPHIITCSWGSHKPFGPLSAADMALAAAIAAAVAAGIIVVFSAGNGHAGFPGQLPDVISAGGVFMHADATFEASNYSSAFMSTIYPGRRVPDVCGLVGMKPKAIYIMLPLQPGDQIDVGNGGGTFPNGDETANNDGWAGFSGTSAAAPQLAGACALIKQACASLTPAQVKSILMSSARDVTTGTSNVVAPFGAQTAAAGPDAATGNGLVDAHKAVLMAKIKCLGPITPITGITPVTSVTPITPITGITPVTTLTPITPITSISPRPITPVTLITPPHPGPTPEQPGPVQPQTEEAKEQPARRLSADDVEALSELMKTGDIDFES